MGYDPSLLEREGYIADSSINYPWLIELSTRMGNAYTQGLARMANVFSDTEAWEGMGGGGNQNWQGAAGHGAIGGNIISW
jgi:hypothetical protein